MLPLDPLFASAASAEEGSVSSDHDLGSFPASVAPSSRGFRATRSFSKRINQPNVAAGASHAAAESSTQPLPSSSSTPTRVRFKPTPQSEVVPDKHRAQGRSTAVNSRELRKELNAALGLQAHLELHTSVGGVYMDELRYPSVDVGDGTHVNLPGMKEVLIPRGAFHLTLYDSKGEASETPPEAKREDFLLPSLHFFPPVSPLPSLLMPE